MSTEPSTPVERTGSACPPAFALRTAPPCVQAALYVSVVRPRLDEFARARLRQYRVPASRLEADDVVQYTIAELLDRWAVVKEPSRYAFTVAGNYVRRVAREGGRFTGGPAKRTGDVDGDQADELDRVDASHLVWSSASPTAPTEHTVAAAEVRADLAAALARLTPAQRQAVGLVDGLGLSRAKAAEVMGVAEGTVSPHRSRGLTKLRHLVGHLRGGLYVVVGLGAAGGLGWLLWWTVREGAAIIGRAERGDLVALAVAASAMLFHLVLPWIARTFNWSVGGMFKVGFMVGRDTERDEAGGRRNRRRTREVK